MSNVMNTPQEVLESEYPLMIEELALRPGSGGDGCHRGGLGFRRAYRVLGSDVTLTTMIERRIVPPYGLFGGKERTWRWPRAMSRPSRSSRGRSRRRGAGRSWFPRT